MSIDSIKNKLGDNLERTNFPSNLIIRITKLIDKNLNKFTPEDFRILIGQEMYLDIILPLSIRLLENDPLISGDYYRGDLLKAVLSINAKFWKDNPELKSRLDNILKKNKNELLKVSEIKDCVSKFTKESI